MGNGLFWDKADLSKTPRSGGGGGSNWLPVGKHRLTLKAIKSLENHGEKAMTGKIFTVTILATDNKDVEVGKDYAIAFWMHLYGANKLRTMIRDSTGATDEELSDGAFLADITDDEDSKLIGLTSTVEGFTKDGKAFVNYFWGVFEELQD
jgi:hypothetical protein